MGKKTSRRKERSKGQPNDGDEKTGAKKSKEKKHDTKNEDDKKDRKEKKGKKDEKENKDTKDKKSKKDKNGKKQKNDKDNGRQKSADPQTNPLDTGAFVKGSAVAEKIVTTEEHVKKGSDDVGDKEEPQRMATTIQTEQLRSRNEHTTTSGAAQNSTTPDWVCDVMDKLGGQTTDDDGDVHPEPVTEEDFKQFERWRRGDCADDRQTTHADESEPEPSESGAESEESEEEDGDDETQSVLLAEAASEANVATGAGTACAMDADTLPEQSESQVKMQ